MLSCCLPIPPSSVGPIAGWSFPFCHNMRLGCGQGGRGSREQGSGLEHCVSELAEVLWALPDGTMWESPKESWFSPAQGSDS